ncbi:MAG: glutamate synthase subunit beta [Hyphomicrobium sp.]
MGKTTGFIEFERVDRKYEPVESRIKHWHEFILPLSDSEVKTQASRCMDCGIPYCHNGCPVNNQIPDWNDLIYQGQWKEASLNLHSTNNFPEITGRVCPAPCEASCTLNIEDKPVTIKTIECMIADRAWSEGWIAPETSERKTGKSIGIIGSGPTGLAAAQQLARAGHEVIVYEKNSRPGGLLVYGIPDFKLEKKIIQRRIRQLESEGVKFECGVHVGIDVKTSDLERRHSALLLAMGSEKPFDFFSSSSGRDLKGIHFAMDFLPQQNSRNYGEAIMKGRSEISAKNKDVVVIGGGDTGSDCIGTSFRQGAKSVTQFEIMPKPPEKENKALSWPNWPIKLRVSSSQAEGCLSKFSISTTGFSGENGQIKNLHYVGVDDKMKPIPGTEGALKADLVLLAMGFSGPIETDVIQELGLKIVNRGRFRGLDANERDYKLAGYRNVYAAGDVRRGQSLVVWAIREGRQAAHAIDKELMGQSILPL